MNEELLALASDLFAEQIFAAASRSIAVTRLRFDLRIPELPETARRRRAEALHGRVIAGYQSVRWEGGRIVAVTNSITLQDSNGEPHAMGQFAVIVEPERPTPVVRSWRAGVTGEAHHPHVSHGNVCFGTWRANLQWAAEAFQYEAILLYTAEILDSYNPGSPFWRLEPRCSCRSGLERRRCHACRRTQGCERCTLRPCVGCARLVCEPCRRTCSACGQAVCEQCRTASETGSWICLRCHRNQQRQPRRRVA